MNIWFILALILAPATLIVFIIWRRSRRKKTGESYRTTSSTKPMGWTVLGLAAATILVVFLSSFAIVSTKNIGIVTNFGNPVGILTNGAHFKAPWMNVTEMDAAIQTDNHYKADPAGESCIQVRMANQGVACVDLSIKWRIKDVSALDLFQNYREFENVRDSLVTRELGGALNVTFEEYNPLATDETGNIAQPHTEDLSQQVKELMQDTVGDRVEIDNVIISLFHFDDNTQSRIDALQAQIAETRIAEQSKLTAAAQAEANRELSSSVSNDPNVLVSKCYDLLNEMVSKGQVIPTGFSCWPGSGSALIVPSAPSVAPQQ